MFTAALEAAKIAAELDPTGISKTIVGVIDGIHQKYEEMKDNKELCEGLCKESESILLILTDLNTGNKTASCQKILKELNDCLIECKKFIDRIATVPATGKEKCVALLKSVANSTKDKDLISKLKNQLETCRGLLEFALSVQIANVVSEMAKKEAQDLEKIQNNNTEIRNQVSTFSEELRGLHKELQSVKEDVKARRDSIVREVVREVIGVEQRVVGAMKEHFNFVNPHFEEKSVEKETFIPKRRQSELPSEASSANEKEAILAILNTLQDIFLEKREEGEISKNFSKYNECLKKVSTPKQQYKLIYIDKDHKHVLCMQGTYLDVQAASAEISKLIELLDVPAQLETSLSSASSAKLPQIDAQISTTDLQMARKLIEAIKQNNQAEVLSLLDSNGKLFGKKAINGVDAKEGATPLYWAVTYGYDHFIALLIKAGADINKSDKDGRTPVYAAAQNGHTKAIVALKAAGANMNTPKPSGATPVFIAAEKGHAAAITVLKAAGADVNTPKWDGATPVFIAAAKGHSEAISALHAAGANMDTPKSSGTTPIWVAAQEGHVEVIRALKAAGANMNTPKPDGTTPVYAAASYGHVPTISALHTAGANVNTVANDGTTPIWIAAQEGHVEAIRALIAAGANVDTPDGDNYTPLYIAAKKGHVAAVTALLEAGANASIQTK